MFVFVINLYQNYVLLDFIFLNIICSSKYLFIFGNFGDEEKLFLSAYKYSNTFDDWYKIVRYYGLLNAFQSLILTA